MDNPKHLLLSTESFTVPAAGRAIVSVEMAATGINAAPRDYRDGFASLNVLDMASGWVFDLCATSDTIFSIYERLPVHGVEHPFSYVVEQPLAGLEIAPGRSHRCEVTLDAGRGAAEWHVDGRLIYDVRGVEVPAELTIGLGLITLHPIVDGTSRSLRGQGLAASFGPISVSVCPNEWGDALAGLSGFDPVIFAVADRAAVDAWSRRLDELGIAHRVELGTIGWAVVFHDPDGLEIHLYSQERHGRDMSD